MTKPTCIISFRRLKKRINKSLREISILLNLSLPLTIKTARETYATTLLRSGVSKGEISEMLGHSNSIVTEHIWQVFKRRRKRKSVVFFLNYIKMKISRKVFRKE